MEIWRGSFIKLDKDLKCLNHFGILNEIACYKLIEMYTSEFYLNTDNVIDKNL